MRTWTCLLLFGALGCAPKAPPAAPSPAPAPALPDGTFGENVAVLSTIDLGETAGMKMGMHTVGGRWYLYAGAQWAAGFHVIDVTDPSAPEVVNFIDGSSFLRCRVATEQTPECIEQARSGTLTVNLQVADGRLVLALEKNFISDAEDHDAGVLIFDLADPVSPALIGRYDDTADGTHRNYYDGGDRVFASLDIAGFGNRSLGILDIADPSAPSLVGQWTLPDMAETDGPIDDPAAPSVHGGAYPSADRSRLYVPCLAGGLYILDITDEAAPETISHLPFSPPLAEHAVHTAMPLRADWLVVSSEAFEEGCSAGVQFIGMVDISDETDPRLVSLLPAPVAPPGADYDSFCEKGGRFGPHNLHQWQNQPALLHDSTRIYVAYFNAGLRIYDTADPYEPVEIGWFIPPDPVELLGSVPSVPRVYTDDVLVDARGNIFISHKNQGIWVLRYAP